MRPVSRIVFGRIREAPSFSVLSESEGFLFYGRNFSVAPRQPTVAAGFRLRAGLLIENPFREIFAEQN